MRHPLNGTFLWRGHRAIGGVGTACLLALVLGPPARAQQQPSALEMLGKAQSQTERQAVEDLINKLQGRSGTGPSPPASATAPKLPAPAATDASASASGALPPAKTPANVAPEPVPANAPAVTATPAVPQVPPMDAAASATTPPSVPSTMVAIEPSLPSADIFVYFDFGSVAVDPKAAEALSALGRALSDARLAKSIFLIAGHTDAKGKPDYNLDLSQRRAEAVRQHLVATYGLAPTRLVALGFGDTRLKDPQQPQSEVNRRVQVVNVTAYAQP